MFYFQLVKVAKYAECCPELANTYTIQAKHKEVIDVLVMARDHFEAIHDQRGVRDYFEILGRIYRRTGAFGEALAELIESRAKRFGDLTCVVIRPHVLETIYRTQGHVDEALAALTTQVTILKKLVPPVM